MKEVTLIPVTDKSDIQIAQHKIENSWKILATLYAYMKLGIKHGNEVFDCYYIENLNAWAAFDLAPSKESPNRFWNAFGIGKLIKDSNNDIICEINFSFCGDRKVAGLIAKDKDNDKYIIHSGRIGGNFNQKIFWNRYSGEIRYIAGSKKPYALVSKLNSDELIKNIINFVYEVHRIKKM